MDQILIDSDSNNHLKINKKEIIVIDDQDDDGEEKNGEAWLKDNQNTSKATIDGLPLMKTGYSLEVDMKFGWKPTITTPALPIPLVFDLRDDYFELVHMSI